MTPNEQDTVQMLSELQDIWTQTKEQIAKSQQLQIRQANKHRREEDFGIGDSVFVTTKDWLQDRPSRKLSHLASGPYKIIEKVGNSYKIDLPEAIRVHPIFHPSKLRKAATTEPLEGQHIDPSPPI